MTMYNEAYDKDWHTVKQANKVILDFVRGYLGWNNRSLKAKLYREYFKEYFSEDICKGVSSGTLNEALEMIDYHFDEETQYVVKTRQDGLDYRAIKLSEELDKDTCAYTIMASLTVKGEKVYLVQEHETRKAYDNFVIINQSDDYGNEYYAVACRTMPTKDQNGLNIILKDNVKTYEEAKELVLSLCKKLNKGTFKSDGFGEPSVSEIEMFDPNHVEDGTWIKMYEKE